MVTSTIESSDKGSLPEPTSFSTLSTSSASPPESIESLPGTAGAKVTVLTSSTCATSTCSDADTCAAPVTVCVREPPPLESDTR